MMVSARASSRDDRLFDEYSLDSMQPSDEWDNDVIDDKPIDEKEYPEEDDCFREIEDHQTTHDESTSPPCSDESETVKERESYFSHQSSFVDYLSHLVPSFSVEGSKISDIGRSFTTELYSRVDIEKPETKSRRPGSSHSRCIIENTESILDRRDEQFRREGKNGEEDCERDQSTVSCSVEEISQISEITMDIPTVVAEQKFPQCSALPTISEVKQFNSPQIAATCASGVRSKVRCAAGNDTTTNKNEGNNDILDFVFELVEDALCKPMKTSKSERKKVFMEAFHEESKKVVKLATKNKTKDPFRESRKHSRNSTSTKRSNNKPINTPSPMGTKVELATDEVETSTHTSRSVDRSRMQIVDKPPLRDPGLQNDFSLDEELTMDWSKMMSLAEKQLEAEEKSVASKDSRMSEVSKMTEKSSFYQSVRLENCESYDKSKTSNKLPKIVKSMGPSNGAKTTFVIGQSNAKYSVTSSVSTSSSTHATLADDVVQELRELSALDSSSFEEESSFLLTSTLFRFMRSLIPNFGGVSEKSSKGGEHGELAFDEISEASIPYILSVDNEMLTCPNEECTNEEMTFKIIRYIAFFYAFVFWPSGVARRQITHPPLCVLKKKRADNKPTSLLQLVSGK